VSIQLRPSSSLHWHLKGPPPPFLSHSHHAAHTNRDLCVFMAQRSETSRSPQLQPALSDPKVGISTPLSHSFAHFSQGDSPWAHSVLFSALLLWCDPSLLVILLWSFSPPKPPPSIMPRPRGKPRRGAAWYEARGRKPPPSDPPCEASSPPQEVSPHRELAPSPPLAPMDNHPTKAGFPPPLAPFSRALSF
jgi:hypothetical protein